MKTKTMMLCAILAVASACADRAPPAEVASETAMASVAPTADKLDAPAQVSAASESVSAGSPSVQVALDRFGDIVIGTAFADLETRGPWRAAMGADLGVPESCEIYTGPALSEAVSMMVVDGRVARFDLNEAGQSGPFGVRIGATEEEARALLPKAIEVEPHHYGSNGEDHYLSWRSPDGKGSLRVETMQGKVQAIYWGDWNAVQFVEGCL